MAPRKTELLNTLSTDDLKKLLAARERIDVLEREQATLRAALLKVDTELAQLLSGTVGEGKPARRGPGRPAGSGGKKIARKKATSRKVGRKATGKNTATKKSAAGKTAPEEAASKKVAKKKVAKKKVAKKKTAKKKTAKKKVTRKKAAKKAIAKKTATRKASIRKTGAGKAVAKKTARKPGKAASRKADAGTGAGRPRLEDVIVTVIAKLGGPVTYKDLYAAIVDGKLFATRSDNFDNVMRRTLSTSARVRRVGRGLYDVG